MIGYIPMRLVRWEDIRCTVSCAPHMEGPMVPVPGTAGVMLVFETEAAALKQYPDSEIVQIRIGEVDR